MDRISSSGNQAASLELFYRTAENDHTIVLKDILQRNLAISLYQPMVGLQSNPSLRCV